MKALTALPTQAYVQVGEEANVPLQDLLQLVQELETNVSPAYIARYRPDVAAGLSVDRIQDIQNRLRSFLDLADRRVTILTAINQQGRLTPELREQIEASMDRRELEDLYLPFKPKRRTPADDAVDKGLEGLAMFLWKQEASDGLDAEAAKYVKAEGDSAESAVAGACDIIARWLGENAEIRRDIRKIARAEAEIVVQALEPKRRLSGRDENQRKRFASMDGYRAPVAKAPWRQVLSIRRGAREGWLQFGIEMPTGRALQYLEGRLVRSAESPFAPHLKDAARKALEDYLAPAIEKELRQELDERCDAQAVELYKKNLRKLLLAPPAGSRPIVGLETNRPGGWRAAVIGPDGELLEAAIVREDPNAEPAEATGEGKPAEKPKQAEAKQADDQAQRPSAEQPEAAEEPTPEPAGQAQTGNEAPDAGPEATKQEEKPEPEQAEAKQPEAQPQEAPAEAPQAVEQPTLERAAQEQAESAPEPAATPAEHAQMQQPSLAEDRPEMEAEVRAAPETSAMTAPASESGGEAESEEPATSQGSLQFDPPANEPAARAAGAF